MFSNSKFYYQMQKYPNSKKYCKKGWSRQDSLIIFVRSYNFFLLAKYGGTHGQPVCVYLIEPLYKQQHGNTTPNRK